MGTLYYGSLQTPVTIGDRVLAHVKSVTTAKLRRRESFFISWNQPIKHGGGRVAIWIHPSADLIYVFEDGAAPPLDPALLEILSSAAMSSSGIVIDAELAGSLK